MKGSPPDRSALRESASAIPVGRGTFDHDLRFLTVDAMLADLHGLPAEMMIGRPLSSALPGLAPVVAPLLKHVLNTGEPIRDADVHGELPGGGHCRWLASYYPVATSTGTVIAVECAVYALDQRAPFTALATTQAALHQATSQLAFQAHILANLNDAVIALDAALRITYWGPGLELLYSLRSQDVLNRHLGDVLVYDWLDPADRQELRAAIESTGVWRGEVRLGRRGAAPLSVAASVSTLTNGSGQIIGFLAVIRDITARRRAEAALRASEERFRAAQELSLDGIAIMRALRDAEGAVVDFACEYLNPVAERLVGQPLAAVKGRRLTQYFPGALMNGLLDRLCQVVASGQPQVFEQHYNADGLDAWYRNVVVCVEGGLAISFGDITSAKRAEQRQAHLLSFTSALAEAITLEQVLKVIFEKVYQVIAVQAGALALLDEDGRSVELLQMQFSSTDRRVLRRRIDLSMPFPTMDAIKHGQPIWIATPAEIMARYPLLQEFLPEPGACAALPLTIQQRTIGALGMIFACPRDFPLDDQVNLQVVAQQCALALDRARLYEAERRARLDAEEAVRARDDLLSVVSHDLRNPLMVILGQAQLMAKQARRIGEAAQPIDARIAVVVDMVGQMNGQLEDLLDTARLRAGQRLILNLQPLDIDGLIREVAQAAQATSARHAILLAPSALPLLCRGDRRRLMLVFENLLSNALAYSPGGGEVGVHAATLEDDLGAWAVVRVQDAGLGIPAADLPRVFERFYRGSNVAGRIGGTGLGLASARQIIEQHRGRIEVVSIEGQGSTFSVYLPLEC